MTPSHNGTVASIPAWKGPTLPDINRIGSFRLNAGMIVRDSSPARKVDDEMERDGERGVCPKKEMEEGADVRPAAEGVVVIVG